MDQVDLIVLLTSFTGFIFFLIIHVFALRMFKKFAAPLAIIGSICGGLILNLILLGLSYQDVNQQLSLVDLFFASGVSVLIYLFLVLHYIAFVFGMGEASIRVRLLSEVTDAGERGVTAEQLLNRYNAKQILEVRLGRLISAGHFKFDGTRYEVKSKILLLQLVLINFFKFLLGINRHCEEAVGPTKQSKI